ncbi:MAG TPA: hypothetical protein DGL25_00140 [Dehalococcoidia bacterium]|nr:hypothetical protein [Dehalococcoidia bacterium]
MSLDSYAASGQAGLMSFREAMESGAFPVSLEITPPRIPKKAVLLRRARLLDSRTLTVNVIQRPDRQSSLEAALELRREGLEPIWHLTTRGRSGKDIAADVTQAQNGGLRHVLCLRGDQVQESGGIAVVEAIGVIREQAPEMAIGAALDQYRGNESTDRLLAAKLRAGAGSVWTQPVFEVAPLLRAASFVKAVRPDAHVVAMAMPLLTSESLDAISERLRIPAPEALRRRIQMGEEEAWRAFEETLAILAGEELVDAVALMTYRADPPEGTAERLLSGLQRMGIGKAASPSTDC